MSKLVVLCLCLCAATVVIEGKPKRRAEPPKTPRPFEPDSPEFDDLFFPDFQSIKKYFCLVDIQSGYLESGYPAHSHRILGKHDKKAPPTVTKKQVPAQKKKEEVTVKTKTPGGKVHLSKAKDGVVNQRVAVTDNRKIPQIVSRQRVDDDDDDSEDYLDDDSDYDDDDDNGNISFLKPTAPPVFITTGRPVVLPTRRSTVLAFEKPMVPPNKRPVVSPTGPLALPTGRPVVRANLRPTIHSARRTVFMESLPAGCLLSESLIACGSTGMTQIPIIRDAGVRTLYLADNKISKIPARALAGLPNLEWLDLSKNKLDDSSLGLDLFQNLTKLRRLNLDGNNLTKVPALPSSLVELKINDNKLLGLTANSFKGLSNLLTLELEDNHFHDGNVSPLTFRPLRKLIYLRLDDNKFRAVPSGLPISLQELHLSDNRIEEVHAGPLNKTVNLRILDLSHNRIREDRIAPRAWIHLQKLESLDLSRNKLVHVPSFLPVGLRQLTLHHNQIERIPGYVFAHMRPGLDSLQLSYNRLHEDGINEVSFLGLYHSLSELLLDHNQLRAIPRGLLQLKTLQLLRLNNNYISYVPLNAICDTTVSEDSPLLSVHLENNLIDRRLIPPTAFSCIKTYHSVLLRPQRYEEHYE
ncbi:extracellular matrix protein 2 [Chanos chanos]|uniref:Extracellular matrix protein 2 n=1 Tax=Chanos chanos TaxID=29144 RepID=A0A6J2W9K1_CHACN|nr:extracellular matrix protein 2-like [Chanos chanos]